MNTKLILFLLFFPLFAGAMETNPDREFRGAWIATVMNIDWPSSRYLSTEDQKRELVAYLDLLKAANFNAVVFQARPSTDAFYQSDIEGWSRWLTGTYGKRPSPFYDPLEFLIKEARKRCLEVHVWLNPYRALTNYKKDQIPSNHICNRRAEWFLDYGKARYFNPGLPQVQDYICGVVQDILKRYDVDAIHFDDYFYPYLIPGEDFPDERTFNRYSLEYEFIDDWRRANVNKIIKKLHHSIKSLKPYVRFGISPFGVWRNDYDDPRGSATRALQTNYDHLYADVVNWLDSGYLDYVVPQLYWEIGHKRVGYKVLAKWWAKISKTAHLYIGHGLYNLKATARKKTWRSPKQILQQININRNTSNIKGSLMYSSKYLKNNTLGIRDQLSKLYKYPALIPHLSREEGSVQPPTRFRLRGNKLSWKAAKAAKYYVVYVVEKNTKLAELDSRSILTRTGETSVDLSSLGMANLHAQYDFYVSAIDRFHRESKLSKKPRIQ